MTLEFAVGQRWVDRDGDISTITCVDQDGGAQARDEKLGAVFCYSASGQFFYAGERQSAHPCDLVALLPRRLYIAGPMTGIPDLNFPAFHAAAARYRAEGATVLNPAEINPDPAANWSDCMRADIAQLVTCDEIVMLDGWTSSRGACLEHTIACALGLTVTHPPK